LNGSAENIEKKRLNILSRLAIVLSVIFLFSSQGFATQEDLLSKKIILQLRWFHQFQFAGFYAAKEKKIFEKYGLDVEIRQGGNNIYTVGEVMGGRAQFGVTNSEILLARLKHKKPVVLVASVFQHSPLAFISRKDSGINTLTDFVGKRIKMSKANRDLELHAALYNEGILLDQFELIDGTGKIDHLFDPTIHALAVYITNQPYHYEQQNIEYQIIRPSDYGVDFYGDSIFTSDAFAKAHPRIVSAFKKASIEGWRYALIQKKEMIDIILDKYNPDKSRSHLEYEAHAIEKFIIPNLVDIGHINPERLHQIAQVFVRHKAIPENYSIEGLIFDSNLGQKNTWIWKALAIMAGATVLFAIIIVTLFVFNSRLNREISEKEASQTALKQNETRLKAMVENIHSGVAIIRAVNNGEDFEIKNLNKAAQAIENVDLTDVKNQLFSKEFPYSLRSGLFKVIQRVYQTGNPEHLPTSQYIGHQIEGWRENYIYRLPSKEIAIVYNDETIRKKMEIHRKHLDTVNHIIINATPAGEMLKDLLDVMLDIFETDRAWLLYPGDPKSEYFTIKVESNRPQWPGLGASDEKRHMESGIQKYIGEALMTDQPIADDITTNKNSLDTFSKKYNIQSSLRMAIYPKIDRPWILGVHRCEKNLPWTNSEKQLFKTVGRRISDGLNTMLLVQELKKANKTLLDSEDQFLKIFHSSPIGIMMTNMAELRIISINKSFLNITGYTEKQVLGRSLTSDSFLFPREHAPDTDRFKKQEYLQQLDVIFHTCDNEPRDGRLSSQWVTINNKQFIIFTVEDITAYKKAELEKQAAHQHAAEQEKYALIGQVAGKMAHDFNNILGAIMGNTEISLMDCEDPEIEQTLELILDQTKKGRALTKNLVVFAKDQEPKQDYFDINEKVNLVLSLIKKDLEGIEVTTYFSRDIPELLGDPGMIENALMNLLHNAIHAMSKTKRPLLIINTLVQDDSIMITIEDNGCGIPKEHQSSIYTPAFTLKDKKDVINAYGKNIKGSGYGLFNVKKIIEKHKGQIQFETHVGQGTYFSISFPVIQKELTSIEIEQVEQSMYYSSKRILIVEDEPSIYNVQSAILSKPPLLHTIDVAVNGQMAIEYLDQNEYDLISMDYQLPGGLNGMDLYTQIREKNSEIPILFVSGNIQFLESVDLLKTKDNNLECLSKPSQNKVYIDYINSMFQQCDV